MNIIMDWYSLLIKLMTKLIKYLYGCLATSGCGGSVAAGDQEWLILQEGQNIPVL
jgi:hypothetical protein